MVGVESMERKMAWLDFSSATVRAAYVAWAVSYDQRLRERGIGMDEKRNEEFVRWLRESAARAARKSRLP